jgi:hypothetical protein
MEFSIESNCHSAQTEHGEPGNRWDVASVFSDSSSHFSVNESKRHHGPLLHI